MSHITYVSLNSELRVCNPKHAGKNEDGKIQARASAKFKEGVLKLNEKDEMDAQLITMLDSHPGNEENGGTSFKRQSDAVNGIEAMHQGLTYASLPKGGVTAEDEEILEYLSDLSPSMPANAMPNLIKKVIGVFERFNVAGIARPKKGIKYIRLKARVIELLATLEEREIWGHDVDIEGKEHPGQSTKED